MGYKLFTKFHGHPSAPHKKDFTCFRSDALWPMEPPCQELFLGDRQIVLNTTGFYREESQLVRGSSKALFHTTCKGFFWSLKFFQTKRENQLPQIIQLDFCHCIHRHPQFDVRKSKGKVGYPWESTRDIYQHIPPIYGLYNVYNCCIRQYGVKLGEQLLGYTPKDLYFRDVQMTLTPEVLAVNVSCVPLDMCSPWRGGQVARAGTGGVKGGWGLLYHAFGKRIPSDSSRDLFGMVKTWPFQGWIVTSN